MLHHCARLLAATLPFSPRAGNAFESCKRAQRPFAIAMSLFLVSGAGLAAAQESGAAEALATNGNPQQTLTEAAEQGDVPVKSRAQSALKYLGSPTQLIVASPFPGSIPVNLATSLSSATRLWALKQNFQNPAREYSIAGRSPLIRGGVSTRLANQSIQQTPLKEISSLDNEAALAQDSAETIARLEAIGNYNAVIAELEGEGGVWNSDLIEELYSLGTLLQQQGSHEEAIKLFDRAVHINRINLGLHAVEQVPAIESKIQSYLALNQWQDADLTFEYLYYIQRRAYGTRDPRLIPVLSSIAEWNLRAFHLGHGEALGMRLNNALMFWNAAASMVKTHYGRQDERFVIYLRGIANSSYLLSRNPEMMAELGSPQFRNELAVNRVHLGQPDEYESRGYSSGAQALTEILRYELDKRDDVLALADAFTNLADWYLIFGRRRAAEEQYGNAWRLLANQPNADALHKAYFGRVVPMPSFVGEENKLHEINSLLQGEESLESDYADIMFEVNDSGIVRDVRVISAETEDNKDQLSRLRRMVRNSYFRPIIKDGVPQRSEGNVFRYQYWY
jgi:tetratricopeptide (TPR) repeat protein